MSTFNDLLNRLCPNGVAFKPINELIVKAPKSSKGVGGISEMDEGPYIAFTSGTRVFKVNEFLVDGEYIFMNDGGQADTNYYKGKAYYSDHVFAFTSKDINVRFLYYYLLKINDIINSEYFRGGGIKNLVKKEFLQIRVPVPPLDVQNEVVRILDNFSNVVFNLKKELIARQKQYDFYKTQLFDSLNQYPICHITDIALIKARVGWQRLTKAEYLQTGNYYLITGTDFNNGLINFSTCVFVSKERYEMDPYIIVHKDDVLITKDGTLGKVAFISSEPDKPATLNSGVFRIKADKTKVYPRYLYHYFTSKDFTDFVESVKTGSTIPHLTQEGLVTLNIPLPPINKQVEISEMLDTFEDYCNNPSRGLLNEINAREKQYEFYREELLTFKEKKNEY